jgi:hypothetical protein
MPRPWYIPGMSNKKRITVPFSARVNVDLELTVTVPIDDDGEPEWESLEIVEAREGRLSSVDLTDVRETIYNDSVELEALEEAAREAFGKGQGDDA